MRPSIISLFILTLLAGCSKEKTGSGNYLRGKIDGVSFECNSNFWATNGNAGDKIIAFRGNWHLHSIEFYIDGQGADIHPGTYPFVDGIQRNAKLYENNHGYGAGYFFCLGPCALMGSGSITLHEIDKKHVKGTFEFITSLNQATGLTKTVTEGVFNIERD